MSVNTQSREVAADIATLAQNGGAVTVETVEPMIRRGMIRALNPYETEPQPIPLLDEEVWLVCFHAELSVTHPDSVSTEACARRADEGLLEFRRRFRPDPPGDSGDSPG